MKMQKVGFSWDFGEKIVGSSSGGGAFVSGCGEPQTVVTWQDWKK